MKTIVALPLAMASLAALSSIATPVHADERENTANGTGVCQAALPSFEGAIRRRPLGIQNEGTTSSFVSCSLQTTTAFGGSVGTDGFSVVVSNTTAAPQQVTCTGVVGNVLDGATFFPITLTVPAGSGTEFEVAAASRNNGVRFNPNLQVGFNCMLPPGTGINQTFASYDTGD